MQDKTSPRIRKLTQNSSFVQEDKNLLQNNGHSRNLETPIDGYFAHDTSPHIRTDCPRTASLIKTDGEIGAPYVAASCFCLGVRMVAKIQKSRSPKTTA